MIAGAARRTLALFTGAAGAVGTAIILIVFGPRLADLPGSVGDVPGWFTAAPEQALVTVVGAVAWLCLLWLCLGVLLGVAAAGAGGRLSAALARLILPRAMRRLIELGLGVTLVAGVAPVMAAMPAVAVGTHPGPGIAVAASATSLDLDRPATAVLGAAGLPDLDRPAPAAPQLPDLDRPAATPAAGATADAGANPTISVPGLGDAVPVVDLHATAAVSTSSTPPSSPDAAQSGAPAAPDPGPPVRLTAARTSVSWPDLERPATDPPRTAAPSTAPTGPAPAGGASTAPAPKPSFSAPAHDPLVPSSHRGTGVAASPAGTGQSPRTDEAEEVVVLRGDSLWTIAARHLGPTATHEQISVEWHRWWAANSDVIGRDPNLILPGQRLVPPSGP